VPPIAPGRQGLAANRGIVAVTGTACHIDPSMIEFRGVTHVYRRFPERRVQAVDDFSLTINAGEILGIAGPNGAGKTTLISMVLG
jgi:ATP-binding cassette, subfamily B, multidrug efflux pump